MLKEKSFPIPDNLTLQKPKNVALLVENNTYKMLLAYVYTMSTISINGKEPMGCVISSFELGSYLQINRKKVSTYRSYGEQRFHLVSFGRDKGKRFFLSPLLLHTDDWEDLRRFGTPNNCNLNPHNGIPEPYDRSFSSLIFNSSSKLKNGHLPTLKQKIVHFD